jgi:surface polysaccharide O-acyltransferase-like enzyme
MAQPVSVRELARTTPAERNRAVDAVRAIAILAVVIGHWLMAVLYFNDNDDIRRKSILGLADWTHLATWPFQVIPLIMVVGGYANAISWRHAVAEQTSYAEWLKLRVRRLAMPVVPLLLFWLVVDPTARAFGVDPTTMRIADRAAMVPLWFLTAYIIVTALTPMTLRLWERYGWASIVGGLLLAGLGDYLSITLGNLTIGVVGSLVVWCTTTQLGYAWRDDRLSSVWLRLGLAVGGLAAVWLLTHQGPYMVSMVGVDVPGIDNARPARVTLALLGVAMAGVYSLLAPLLTLACRQAAVWTVVVALNARIMTIYLWHLTAVALVVLAAPLITPPGAEKVAMTAEWWWTRPMWVLMLAVMTTFLVSLFGRFEQPDKHAGRAWPAPVQFLVAMAIALGIALISWKGIVEGQQGDGAFHWELPLALAALIVGQSAAAARRT